MHNDQKVLTVDMGTHKVRTTLTVFYPQRKTIITTAPSRGIKGGNIVNFQSAKDSLNSALNRLKVESHIAVPVEAYALITGAHTISYAVESKIVFPGIQAITHTEVNDVKNKAKKELLRKLGQTVRSYYDVIHIIPQEFIVDNLRGIQNPIGHNGRELTMKAFVILGAKSSIRTINSLFEKVGLKLKGVVLQSLAASYGIRDERTYLNNNLVLYMGAGTTEYLYFKEDKPVSFGYIPFGSEDVIDNLVQQLKLSRKEAEKLFLKCGSAYAFKVSKEETVNVNYGTVTRKLPRVLISALIHAQLKKLFKDVKEKLNSADKSYVSNLNRVYMTGGLAKLKDIDVLAEKSFKAPAVVPDAQDTVVKDTALSPAVGVANFLYSMSSGRKLTDIKEDITKSFSEQGWVPRIRRFIMELI